MSLNTDSKILREYALWKETQKRPSNQLKTLENSIQYLDKKHFTTKESFAANGEVTITITYHPKTFK